MSRKITALILSFVLLMALFTACTGGNGTSPTTAATTAAATTAAATTTAATTAAATTTAATTAATTAKPATTATTVVATTAQPVENLDFVTLDWYNVMSPPEMPDTKMVWEALNKYFKEKINAQVEIHLSNSADLRTKGSTMIAAGQAFDVIYSGQGVEYPINAANNAFVALDDLLPEYAPLTLAQIPQYAWDAVRVKGTIYTVPVYKDLAQRINLIYNKTMCDTIGISPLDYPFESAIDMVEFYYDAKPLRDAKYPELAEKPMLKDIGGMFNFHYYDNILNNHIICNIPGINDYAGNPDGKTVFDIYATDEYRNFVNLMKQMVDDNIVPYDAKNYDTDRALRSAGEFIGVIGAGSISVQPDIYSDLFDSALYVASQAYVCTSKITGNGQAVSVTSPNPERALMMLELVNNDNYVATTLRFGIEGVHHSVEPNGQINVDGGPNNADPKNRGYYYWYGHQVGSIFVMSVPSFEPENFFDLMDEINRTAIVAATMGFSMDTANVTTEVATVSSVISEYADLNTGMVDNPDAMLDEMLEALKAAGSEKLLAEAQTQLDAWFAK